MSLGRAVTFADAPRLCSIGSSFDFCLASNHRLMSALPPTAAKKRTSFKSGLCHYRKWLGLFNHLVGADEKRLRSLSSSRSEFAPSQVRVDIFAAKIHRRGVKPEFFATLTFRARETPNI
jgi:hypothetical protein